MTEHQHELDATGLLCPLPVLKFKKMIKQLLTGAVIKISATDPDSVKDFNVFTQMKNFELLGSTDTDGVFTFIVKI
ncbi:MAG: sulfurtransferase TusA family protein [Algicola sp.]|nr:sulfurtransferase TusA family protein [Algicola sp.]